MGQWVSRVAGEEGSGKKRFRFTIGLSGFIDLCVAHLSIKMVCSFINYISMYLQMCACIYTHYMHIYKFTYNFVYF